MIVWHFLYDLASAGLVPETLLQSPVMELARYAVAGSFIAISGVCARLSKRPLRRGLIVLAAALLVSAVTYLIRAPVYWGILHLLGVCMLLYAAVRKRWERLPATAACGAALRAKLIGARSHRGELDALIRAEDAGLAAGLAVSPANLEQIMVHLEREAEA